jgi:hypothetical protein
MLLLVRTTLRLPLFHSPPRAYLYSHVSILIPRPAVDTAQTLQGISAQILQNQKDLPIAIAANQAAGAVGDDGGAAAISGAFAFSSLHMFARSLVQWADLMFV